MKANGQTAYFDAFRTDSVGEITKFGEVVMARRNVSDSGAIQGIGEGRLTKADTPWDRGLWLGRTEGTDEHIIGDEHGVYMTRSIRRLNDSDQYMKELILKMKGLPWDLTGGALGKLRGRKRTDMMPVALEPDKTTKKAPAPTESSAPAATEAKAAASSSATAPSAETAKESEDAGMGASAAAAAAPPPPPQTRSPPAPTSPTTSPPEKKSRILENLARWDEEVRVSRRALPEADQPTSPTGEPAERRARVTAVADDEDEVVMDDEEYELDDENIISEEEIRAAKAKELGRMVEFGLYEAVPRSSAQGKHFISTKWVVVRKGDGSVRARYVCREFKAGKKRDDLFAPSTTTITMRVIDVVACKKRLCTLTGDISNAFFHAPEDEEVYYHPPAEWYEENPEMEGMIWRGLKQLYGRRKATKNFAKLMGGVLKENCGMDQCAAAPHLFRNAARGVILELHVDDCHACGPQEQLEALQADIEKSVMVKEFVIRDPDHEEEYEHLQRKRHMMHDGTWLYANPKHIEEVMRIWNLEECKPANCRAWRTRRRATRTWRNLRATRLRSTVAVWASCSTLRTTDPIASSPSESAPSTSRGPRQGH